MSIPWRVHSLNFNANCIEDSPGNKMKHLCGFNDCQHCRPKLFPCPSLPITLHTSNVQIYPLSLMTSINIKVVHPSQGITI